MVQRWTHSGRDGNWQQRGARVQGLGATVVKRDGSDVATPGRRAKKRLATVGAGVSMKGIVSAAGRAASRGHDCGAAVQRCSGAAAQRSSGCLGAAHLGCDDAVGRKVDYAALTKVGGRCAFK
jgi:hypothetical protein